jgi:hypothetical protein
MNSNDASKSSLSHQRRTQSVDEYSLQKLSEEFYGIDEENTDQTLTNGNDKTVKECGDSYMCAALPRTNNRPSARTCWLVFSFLL